MLHLGTCTKQPKALLAASCFKHTKLTTPVLGKLTVEFSRLIIHNIFIYKRILQKLRMLSNKKTTIALIAIAAVLVLFAAAPLVTTHQANAFWGGGWGGGWGGWGGGWGGWGGGCGGWGGGCGGCGGWW